MMLYFYGMLLACAFSLFIFFIYCTIKTYRQGKEMENKYPLIEINNRLTAIEKKLHPKWLKIGVILLFIETGRNCVIISFNNLDVKIATSESKFNNIKTYTIAAMQKSIDKGEFKQVL